jgi:hypothetical protein
MLDDTQVSTKNTTELVSSLDKGLIILVCKAHYYHELLTAVVNSELQFP